ncbi:hypothetical protein EDB83DRAFT_2580422 [Lactarius deliciosus]|nr:hypothetical protein EDB83DRAFT_2580422 [Lactarius deliciosus]
MTSLGTTNISVDKLRQTQTTAGTHADVPSQIQTPSTKRYHRRPTEQTTTLGTCKPDRLCSTGTSPVPHPPTRMMTIIAQTMTGPTPTPFTGDQLALSFIRGPLTDSWRQTVQNGSPDDMEDEELWDEFYDSFCTAWTDDLPTPMPQTPSPLAPIDASPRAEELQVIVTPVQTTAVPSPNAEDDLDFKEFYSSYLDDNTGIFSPCAPTLTPPLSIFDLVRPVEETVHLSTFTAPLPLTLPDADEDWTLFAPRVVSVLTPFVSTPQTDRAAQRVEKCQRDYTSEEGETRPSKYPRPETHTGPPRASPQLGQRSVPLPRNVSPFIVPYSPPPRRPPSPPDDPGPPVPAALPPGRRHTIVEDDNNRRGGVKTLDSSVFAPDVAVSPTLTPVLDSPRPPTPHTPPPRRPDIFPRLALEMPRDPDSLATHLTNSRRRGNAHPRTPAQTTTNTPSTTVDPVNTPPTRLAPVSAQNAVDSPPQTPPHAHPFPCHAIERSRDPDELATNRQRRGNTRSPYPATSHNHTRHARQDQPTASPANAPPIPVTSRLPRATATGTSAPHTDTQTDQHKSNSKPDRQQNRANAAVEVFLEQYDAARTTSAPTPIRARRTYDTVMQHLDLRLPKNPDTTGVTQPFALKVGPSAILR